MGASAVPIVVFTVLWGIVGIVCPIFAPKGPNRGIIQVILMLTAATCWLFWLCAYMAQMNPLIGPRLSNETLIWIQRSWYEMMNPLVHYGIGTLDSIPLGWSVYNFVTIGNPINKTQV